MAQPASMGCVHLLHPTPRVRPCNWESCSLGHVQKAIMNLCLIAEAGKAAHSGC